MWFLRSLWTTIAKIRQWDWQAITFCLLISTFVWFVNAFSKTYTTTIQYPVHIKLNRADVVPLTPAPNKLNLEVTGLGWDLLRYVFSTSKEPLSIAVDNPVRLQFITSKSFKNLIDNKLSSLKIQKIKEDTLFFNYDYHGSRRVAIVVDKKHIPLKKDYHIVSPIKIVPTKVIIKGAASLLRNLPDTLFVKFPNEISENFNQNALLDLPANDLLKPETEKIYVSFKVSRFVQKNVKIDIAYRNFPADSSFRLAAQKATVRYLVAEENENFAPDSLRIVADFNDISWRDSTVMPRVYTPRFFTEIIISPAKIKVIYEKDRNNRRNRRG